MKALVGALVLWSQLGAAASAAERFPCLPPLDDLVKARLAMLDARQATEQDVERVALKNNGYLNKLLLDRLSGTYSYGKGLTVDSSIDGSAAHSFVRTDNSKSSWSISYTLPFNAFTDKEVTEAKVKEAVLLLKEKQQLERKDEATKINLQYEDFLAAQQTLISRCTTASPDNDEKCLPLIFLVKKTTVNLLCLSGRKEPETCPEWKSVAPPYAALLKEDLACIEPE